MWSERPDPKKHVFEDLGIAAFLILLWCRWWGDKMRGVPGGFVDVRCSNGLLVWILNQEGFKGFGFDLRQRRSWKVYGQEADLRERAFVPTKFVEHHLVDEADKVDGQDQSKEKGEGEGKGGGDNDPSDLFPTHCFVISNHTDELTLWLPLLATSLKLTMGCAGFLNIPCCPFLINRTKFSATCYTLPRDVVGTYLGSSQSGGGVSQEEKGNCNSLVSNVRCMIVARHCLCTQKEMDWQPVRQSQG